MKTILIIMLLLATLLQANTKIRRSSLDSSIFADTAEAQYMTIETCIMNPVNVQQAIDNYSYNSTEVWTTAEVRSNTINTSAEVRTIIDNYSYNSTEVWTTAEVRSNTINTSVEVQTIIDAYGVNSTEVILKSGSIAFTGDQSLGGNNLTNVGEIAGVSGDFSGTVEVKTIRLETIADPGSSDYGNTGEIIFSATHVYIYTGVADGWGRCTIETGF